MDRGRVGSKRRLRRPEPGRAVHWRDRRRSRVAEAMSRANVLGGQLAEALGRPSRLLGPDSWRRPWRRWPGHDADDVLRSRDPSTALSSEARSDFAEGVADAEGVAAPPPSRSEPAGSVYLVVCVCFRGCRGPNILSSCCKAVFLFLLFRVSRLVCQ
jgi:hypothetical protein